MFITSTPPGTQLPSYSLLAAARAGTKDNPLLVIISLDVEEEGLFSGNYASRPCSVHNVPLLRALLPLSLETSIPLTLLCAHPVFEDKAARVTLEYLRDKGGAEIGAHLHHWSTPPFDANVQLQSSPVRTHRLDKYMLRARLQTLLAAGRDFQGAPLTSFRMGRWDCKAELFPLLAEEGIEVDSSVCPLRAFDAGKEVAGPDHFLAPADPYWVPAGDHAPLLEAPITQLPLLPWLPRVWYGLYKGKFFLDSFRFCAALSANPFWHGPRVMRMAVERHVARGGRVLNMFWHSSEMLPGASPHTPDQAAADAFLVRLRDFLLWLRSRFHVRGITLSSLRQEGGFGSRPSGQGDW